MTRHARSTRRALLGAVALTTGLLSAGTTTLTAASASASSRNVPAIVAAKHKLGHKAKKTTHKKTTHKKRTTAKTTTPVVDENPGTANLGITEEGSTLLLPLFEQWSTDFHHLHPNIGVTPGGGGSGKGISDAIGGVVDIGASDAYLSPTQVQQNPGIKNIALAISAQMINYNIPFMKAGTHLRLNGQVLSQIYQGQITNWNDQAIEQLNPGVVIPSTPIVTVHRSDGSGDTFLFSSYLSAADPNGWGAKIGYGTSVAFPSIPNALAASGNGGMVTTCQKTPGCIAYIGVSFESQTNSDGLGEAMLQNASGNFELPTASAIQAEARALQSKTPPNETLSMIYDSASNGYPIINYEYAIIPPKESDAATAQAVRALLYWAADPKGGSATKYMQSVNFQPLPPAVRALTDAQIAQITN